MKKKMAIVGMQKEVTEFMVRYIDIMLHDEVEITTFLVEDLAGCIYEFPVVLLTHQYFLPEVSPHFPEAQIVSGPKFLTGQNLEQLLMLPRGMRVMVLSKPYALAAEIIEALRDYGIDHLEYVPMEDGVDIYDRRYRDIETALSPGMEHLVPDYIKHTIDLGARTIGPDTLVALLQALDLSMQYVNVYMKISMNTMLENARKLSASLEKSELLSQGRKIILNEVDDGILIVDGKNEITHFNRALEQILDTDKHKWYGRSAQELLHLIGLEKQKLIEDSKSGNSTIFNYKGKMATCRRVAYQVYDRNEQNVIYTFKEVSKIVELENQIRRQLHQKGYVAKYTFDDIWGEDPKVLSVK